MTKFYTVQSKSVIDGKSKRFMYNDSIYNCIILSNLINKLLFVRLKGLGFILKKNTIPVCGFVLKEGQSIDIRNAVDKSILNCSDSILIEYELSEKEEQELLSVPQSKLVTMNVAFKNDEMRFNKIYKLDLLPMTRAMVKFNGKVLDKDLFVDINNVNFNKSTCFLPRLRTKGIISCTPCPTYLELHSNIISNGDKAI